MNPNTPNNNFELPTPQEGVGELSQNIEAGQNGTQASSQETLGAKQPAQGSVTVQDDQPQQQVVSSKPAQPVSQSQVSSSLPTVAEDSDLIEREWVVKAKQIVAATKDDPHKQNQEINKFKADYLKKRYKKDIKIEEA